MFLILILLVLLSALVLVMISRAGVKPILAVYSVSLFYYSLCAYMYWGIKKDGVFMSINWGENEVGWAALLIAISSMSVIALIFSFDKKYPIVHRPIFLQFSKIQKFNNFFWLILIIGVMAHLYLMSSVIRYGGFDSDDKALLIAYQFSDLLIPSLLFVYASKRHPKWCRFFIFLFTLSVIYFGFRYKAVLLLAPILLAIFFSNNERNSAKSNRTAVMVFSLIAIGVLGASTLIRTKFEGLDFEKFSEGSFDDLLFGLFADANIIFGLISILNSFVERNEFVYFQPIIDSFLEFFPKFIFPGRKSGLYTEDVLRGLIAEEAIYSATAYPFFGEYLLIFGYVGWLIGIVFISVIVFFLYRVISRNAKNESFRMIGIGLLAVFFGYYNFSRGYMPQMVKGLVFIVLPYIFMILNTRFVVRGKKFHE